MPGLARLLGVTGPLDRFASAEKLWAYVGMHVEDGAAPRRRRGRQANWSGQGRVICRQLAISIVRACRGRYREAYDRKKLEYLARPHRGPSACPFGQVHVDRNGRSYACGRAQADAAAQRYAVKLLLGDLWRAWHLCERNP